MGQVDMRLFSTTETVVSVRLTRAKLHITVLQILANCTFTSEVKVLRAVFLSPWPWLSKVKLGITYQTFLGFAIIRQPARFLAQWERRLGPNASGLILSQSLVTVNYSMGTRLVRSRGKGVRHLSSSH